MIADASVAVLTGYPLAIVLSTGIVIFGVGVMSVIMGRYPWEK